MKCSKCSKTINDARSEPPICFDCVENTKMAAFYDELEKIAKLPAYLRHNPDRFPAVLDDYWKPGTSNTAAGDDAAFHLQTKYQGMMEGRGVRDKIQAGLPSTGGFVPRSQIQEMRSSIVNASPELNQVKRPLQNIVEAEDLVKKRSIYDKLPDHMKTLVDDTLEGIYSVDEHLSKSNIVSDLNKALNGGIKEVPKLPEAPKPKIFPWKPVIGAGVAAAAGGLGYLAYKKYKRDKNEGQSHHIGGLDQAEKLATIHLLTGKMGAGKTTARNAITDQYDGVFGSDTVRFENGRSIEPTPEEKAQIRADRRE